MRRIGDCRFEGIERRSRWFRLSRVRSSRWFTCVKDAWPNGCDDGNLTRDQRRELRRRSREFYGERYGNPMIWMFLLEIMIKAIIWWLQNRNEE